MAQQPLQPPKDSNVKGVWPPKQGYQRNLLVNKDDAKEYKCPTCGHLPREAMEIVCDFHDKQESSDDDDGDNSSPTLKIYCKGCLEDYLSKNENRCPLGGHSHPTHQKSGIVRNTISRLKVRCPRVLARTNSRLASLPLFTAINNGMFHNSPNPPTFHTLLNSSITNRPTCQWTGKLKNVDVR